MARVEKKIWCGNQMIDMNMKIVCCAHLAEGRVFDCPYENNEIRMKSEYPCSDYNTNYQEFRE